MKFTTSLLALAGLAGMAIGSALPAGAVISTSPFYKNYPIGLMTFNGTLGGHQVQLNGSIQEIGAQMKTKFPGFDADALVATNAARGFDLFTRNKVQPPACCPIPGQDWRFCNAKVIQDGVDYLNNFDGLCGVGAQNCVRISCSYNSAIYLCNDNDYGITPSCKYMGSYAMDIIRTCAFYDKLGNGYVCGQEFDTDNYNIIVREDIC